MQAAETVLFGLSAKGTIIRYTSKPEKGFIILWLIFYISDMLGEKEKKNKRWTHMRMTQTSTLIADCF